MQRLGQVKGLFKRFGQKLVIKGLTLGVSVYTIWLPIIRRLAILLVLFEHGAPQGMAIRHECGVCTTFTWVGSQTRANTFDLIYVVLINDFIVLIERH